MSGSYSPRIKRSSPKLKLNGSNYRKKALSRLLADFGHRCAYSLRHIKVSGKTAMCVDHVNPTLAGRKKHVYTNLVPAVSQCNGKKLANWPTKDDRKNGIRFLDPCSEQDYGEHLFEDPETHELVAASAAGQYHIDMLDLNAETFVWERKARADFALLSGSGAKQFSGTFSQIKSKVVGMMDIVANSFDFFIPPIPPPPR